MLDFEFVLNFLILARSTNLADFIQPSLVQLQPNLDDFMDTLDPPGKKIELLSRSIFMINVIFLLGEFL